MIRLRMTKQLILLSCLLFIFTLTSCTVTRGGIFARRNPHPKVVQPLGHAVVKPAQPPGHAKGKPVQPPGHTKAKPVQPPGHAKTKPVIPPGHAKAKPVLPPGHTKVKPVQPPGHAKAKPVQPPGHAKAKQGPPTVQAKAKPVPSPPAKAHGSAAVHRYYYYPSVSVYYDITKKVYFYLEGDNWLVSVSLPQNLKTNLGNHVSLELETDKPYTHFKDHKTKYPHSQIKKIHSNKVGLTVQVGFSVLTQDIATFVEGKGGLIIGGKIFYGLNQKANIGLEVEWEMHETEVLSVDYGDLTTITILPFVQIRSDQYDKLSTYALFGVGVNINSFDVSSDYVNACILFYGFPCEVETNNTLALKIGGGFDYFFNNTVALNVEVAWKLNSGEVVETVLGIPVAVEDADTSVITFKGGITILF